MRLLWLWYVLRTVLAITFWVTLFVVATFGSALYHLDLPIARRLARNLTTSFLNGEIRGELQIGSIDELSTKYIVARHASLFDGEGRRIITGDRVEIEPDFAQLRNGLLRFKVGRVRGGTVRLVDNGQGDPSLFTTFDPRKPSTGGESLRALVDQLVLEDMTIYGQFVQLQNVRAEHVYAVGRLSVNDGVDIKIISGEGQMVRPYDFVGEISKVTGSISSDPVQGTRVECIGKRRHTDQDDEEIHVHVAYRADAPYLPLELDLELISSHLHPDTLRRVGYTFAEPLAPPMRGRVQISGPVDNLILSANAQTRAGRAEVSGSFSDTRGVSVHILSDSIQVDQLIDGAPSVRARGLLHISVAPEDGAVPEVHAELAGMRYGAILVPPFVLDGELEDNGIRIERARATQGGQIAVRGRVGFDGRTDLRVDAHFSTVERDPNLSRIVEDLQGSLTTNLHIRTPASDQPARLDIEGKVELVDAVYGSVSARRLQLSGTAHGDPRMPQLDVEVHGDEVQVLYYKLGNARFDLHGGPRNYTARGEFEAKGAKTFSFDAGVTASREGFVIQAEPIEFTVGSESWRGALRELTVLHERSIELGYLRLASRAQRLEANGILRLNGEDALHAQLQNFDVTALRAVLGERFPLTFGYADANLELRGDVDKPELSLTGALRQATFSGLSQLDALYTVSYRDGQLELDSDVDLQDRGTLQLLGQGELDAKTSDPLTALRGGEYKLSLSGKAIDLTLIPQLRGNVHAGRLDGVVELQGGLDAVSLNGRLKTSELRALSWTPIDVEAQFKYERNELASQLSARNSGGQLAKARGSWHVDWDSFNDDPSAYLHDQVLTQDFELQGTTAARALSDLPFQVPLSSWPVHLATRFNLARKSGALKGDAEAVVTPKQRLADPSCKVSSDAKLTTHWQLSNDRATLALEGALEGRSVAAGSGNVQWAFDRLLQAQQPPAAPVLDLNAELDLDQIERVPGLCRHGRGQLKGDLNIRGAGRDAPEASLDLEAEFVPQSLDENGAVAAPVARCAKDPLKLKADLRGDERGLRAHAAAHGCSGGPADLAVQLPWDWSAGQPLPRVDDNRESSVRLDLQDAELEPLLDYLPSVRGFSGKASGQLTAKAKGGRVDARGQVAMSGGRLYAIPTGQELTDVGLILTANGNWLKLDSLSARVGNRGSLEAAGGIGLEGWTPRRLQLGLVLNELPIQREGIDLAWLTGSAAVVGDIEPTLSRTAIKLHSMAVRLPSASSRSLQSLEPHSDIALTHEPAKRVNEQPYSFEFAIDGRNQLTARRNDFDAALASELAVSYRDPELHVGGYIEFQRGTFELFGKRFELNRGSMTFDGGTELNPEVTMVATHEPNVSGGYTVVVNVSGTLAKPEVTFYSDRCPGEGAVVLLVSGRCPSEADSSSTNPAATQNAFAAGILGGILTLGAQRELSGLAPRLAVESSARGTRTRLKAGIEAVPPFMRSLVQRVYFQGAISTADQTASSTGTASGTTPDFLLELYFPNNIVGAGRVAPTTGSWGMDVTWEP